MVDGLILTDDVDFKASATRKRQKRIAVFGDSFLGQNNLYGPWGVTGFVDLPGVAVLGLGLMAPVASNVSLTVNVNRTASFNGGPAVPLRNGGQVVPGPVYGAVDGVFIRVNLADVTSGTATGQTAGSRPDQSYGADSALQWGSAFSNQSIQFVNFAVGGLKTQSLAGDNGVVKDAIERGFLSGLEESFIMIGTNDVASGRALSAMQADMEDVIARLHSAGQRVTFSAQPPVRSDFTTDLQRRKLSEWGSWLRYLAATEVGIDYLPLTDQMFPESGTALRSGYNRDGIHPNDPAFQLQGWNLFRHYGSPTTAPIYFGTNYDAVHAEVPLGNYRANPNFVGDVSGVATGYTKTDSNATGTATKVARTDLASDYQKLSIATVNANGGYSQMLSGNHATSSGLFPEDWTWVQGFAEVICEDCDLAPEYQIVTGGVQSRLNSSTRPGSSSVSLPIKDWSGILATAPVQIRADDTSIKDVLKIAGVNGSNGCQVQFGRATITPVMPLLPLGVI